MGTLEYSSRKRRRKQNIRKIILSSVAAAGLVSVAALAPNALKLLGGIPNFDETSIHRARRRLIETGLLARDDKGLLQVTDKGRLKLRLLEGANFKIKKPRRWNSRWRILIFKLAP